MAIIKAGIVADNFKLEMFKSELDKNRFHDYEIKPFTKGVSNIQVIMDDSRVYELKKLCQRVELYFKSGN